MTSTVHSRSRPGRCRRRVAALAAFAAALAAHALVVAGQQHSCWIPPSPVSGKATIPQVKAVPANSFRGCTELVSVGFSTSVEIVGDNAFQDCRNLVDAPLPSALTYLGSGAFSGCRMLATISVPDGVTAILGSAFQYTTSMLRFAMGSKVSYIGPHAFDGSFLRKVLIPSSVQELGDYAFQATGLETVELPSSVRTAGFGVFMDNANLTRAWFAPGYTTLGRFMFAGCNALDVVAVPNTTREVPDAAFFSCGSLGTVSIPDNVQFGGRGNPFAESVCGDSWYQPGIRLCKCKLVPPEKPWPCDANDTTTTPAPTAPPCWIQPDADGHADVPAGTETIHAAAFRGCEHLVSVSLPPTVTAVEASAFENCAELRSVDLGRVGSIGDRAFYRTPSLRSARVAPGATVGADAFKASGCDASAFGSSNRGGGGGGAGAGANTTLASAAVCDCAPSSEWPCPSRPTPSCAGRDLAACGEAKATWCCNYEVYGCVCREHGSEQFVQTTCVALPNYGIDCDACPESPRCADGSSGP